MRHSKKSLLAGIAVGICGAMAASPSAALANASEAQADAATAISARGEADYSVTLGEFGISAAAAENCGVRVDRPHPSWTTNNQIHTRVESFCKILPVQSNQLSAVSYRSRWFGWEKRGSASNSGAKDIVRVTVAVNCDYGSRHRWRTEGRGVAVIAGRTYTAAAYEQNDSEIACGANN